MSSISPVYNLCIVSVASEYRVDTIVTMKPWKNLSKHATSPIRNPDRRAPLRCRCDSEPQWPRILSDLFFFLEAEFFALFCTSFGLVLVKLELNPDRHCHLRTLIVRFAAPAFNRALQSSRPALQLTAFRGGDLSVAVVVSSLRAFYIIRSLWTKELERRGHFVAERVKHGRLGCGLRSDPRRSVFESLLLRCLVFWKRRKMVPQSSLKSRKRNTGMGGDSHGQDFTVNSADNEAEEYEVLGATLTSSNHLWVDPNILKLLHRIGRGPFGDVWLATIHSSTKEFDEFHEVVVKMLPDAHEHIHSLLQRFQTTYQHVEAVRGVCWPQGITIKHGRACIIMKFFEGSIGDKMAHLPSNKIALEDVLRYGQDLLHGISELHSHEVLALNLKPCNFLLDEQDVAVVGEFGIPMLYAGMVAPSERAVWLGSPNYMAPEQWGANVRGPITFETDCWGFACSMVELLTGDRPWRNLTSEEIFKAVVERHEKPNVPTGLPHSLERVLKRCFEYDYRRRPSVYEILQTFINPNEPFKVGDWVSASEKGNEKSLGIGVVKSVLGPDNIKVQFCDKLSEHTQFSGASQLDSLSLWKDPFQVGDSVRLKLYVGSPRFGWPGGNATEGTISEICIDDAVFVITFVGSQQTWRADPMQLERVSGGLVVNDWVRLRKSTESNGPIPSLVGIVHYIDHLGKLKVSFFGRETLWTGEAADFEKVISLGVGQYVRLKHEVIAPRFKWPLGECGEWDTGRIAHVLPNGGLVVDFPGRLFNGKGWWADPEEIEVVRINEIEGLLKKYQHIEKMHWAVRPAVSLIGLLVAVRTGVVVMNLVTRPFWGKKQAATENDGGMKNGDLSSDHLNKMRKEGSSSLNTVWLPSQVAAATSTVAGIMFGDR